MNVNRDKLLLNISKKGSINETLKKFLFIIKLQENFIDKINFDI